MEKIIVINPKKEDVVAKGPKGKVVGKWPRFRKAWKYNVFEVERVSDKVYLLKDIICSTSNQLEFLKCVSKNSLNPRLSGELDREWSFERANVYLTNALGNTTSFWSIDIAKNPPAFFEFDDWIVSVVWRIELDNGFGFPVKVKISGREIMKLYRNTRLSGEVRDNFYKIYAIVFSKYSNAIRRFIERGDNTGLEEAVSLVEFGERGNEKAKFVVEAIKTFDTEKNIFSSECSRFIDAIANVGKEYPIEYVFDAVMENMYGNLWDAYKVILRGREEFSELFSSSA